jgi:predicted choloylglycine hydrolase
MNPLGAREVKKMKNVKVKLLMILLLFIWLVFCSQGDSNDANVPGESERIRELYDHYDDYFKELLNYIVSATGNEVIKYETINAGALTKKVTITGSYYDLGFHIGMMGREMGIFPRMRTSASQEINNAIIEMYEVIYPQFLEKVRGVADANGLSMDDIDLRNLECDYFVDIAWTLFKYNDFEQLTRFGQSLDSCSLASYYLEPEKRNIVGRNFDYFYDVPRFLVISNIDGVYKTITNSGWALNQWVMDGINEKGLFIGMASNEGIEKYRGYGNQPYPQKPAVDFFHLLRIILERCGTVEEAVELIGKTNVWFSTTYMHFLMADEAGNAVVMEFDHEGNIIPFYKDKNKVYLHVTNTALQEGKDIVRGRCWRYSTAENLLDAGINSIGDLLDVMRAIQAPPNSGAKTLWLSLIDLSKKEIDVRFWEEDYEIAHPFNFTN